MGSFGSGGGNVVYIVACAAPPALETAELVRHLQAHGWHTCVVLTPPTAQWVDLVHLAQLSGHEVRSQFRRPTDTKFTPLGDAVLVAPATFNTINKWAAGISDNLALGLLNEAVGARIPVAVVPWVNGSLAGHPSYQRSLMFLETAGVQIAHDPEPNFRAAALRALEAACQTASVELADLGTSGSVVTDHDGSPNDWDQSTHGALP